MVRRVYSTLVPKQLRLAVWRVKDSEFLAFVRRFGIVAGRRTYRQLRGRSGQCWVRIPQSRTPILVRRDTSDVAVFKQVFLEEEYRPPNGILPALIIDGGANVGYAAIFFANLFPEARVIAVEPEASNVEILRTNTQAYPQVEVVAAAIWPRNGFIRISNPSAEKWEFRVEPSDTEAGLRAVTIEELSQGQRIGLLKLDIEGSEKAVFDAKPSWVQRVDCLMVELHDRFIPGCEQSFRDALAGAPVSIFPQGENWVCVRHHGTPEKLTPEAQTRSER